MVMTDLGEIIALLEQNQDERRERDTVLSERIQLRLSNARTLLAGDNGSGNGTGNGNGSAAVAATNGAADPVYEEIRQSLDRVRQIARDLREGRY